MKDPAVAAEPWPLWYVAWCGALVLLSIVAEGVALIPGMCRRGARR